MNDERSLTTADIAAAHEPGHHSTKARSSLLERDRSAAAEPKPPESPRPDPMRMGSTPSPEPPLPPSAEPKNSEAGIAAETRQQLFAETDAAELRNRWTDVQTGFVDEPRKAVERADSLVADVMKRLAESFAAERRTLEQQWDRGDNVTTEDLRVVLQRYRTFFGKLLAV